jgi:broad specificity phosphatase PhoE
MRPPITRPEDAYVTALTPEGCQAARDFGRRLAQRWSIGAVVASPAPRCMQTAFEVARGACDGRYPHPAVQPLLALHFDQRLTGVPSLARVYLNDPGFTDLACRPGSGEHRAFIENLLASLPFPDQPGVLNLAATHDVVVTLLQAAFLGLPSASVDDFPGYLEGVCLVKQGGAVRLV